MNDFQKQLYNASLTAAINQSKLSIKPIKLQLDAINSLYKNTFIQLDFTKLLENISKQLNETSNLAQVFPSKALNNLINVQMNQIQIQNKINTMIKESLTLSTKVLTSELDKLNKTLSIAMPYLPEDVVEEVQEEFEEQIQENNELLNTSELDKNILKKFLLRKNIIFSLSMLITIVSYIYDRNLSILILNAILNGYTLISEPKSKK